MSKSIQFKNSNNEKLYPHPYYPIGSIYISVVNTNPSKWFGGTWVAFGTGRCLVGVDTSQTEFNTVQKTGGKKTHTLTLKEIPKHQHDIVFGSSTSTNGVSVSYSGSGKKVLNIDGWGWQNNTDNGYAGRGNNIFASAEGGGGAHNNLQPYITVYMWRRTA